MLTWAEFERAIAYAEAGPNSLTASVGAEHVHLIGPAKAKSDRAIEPPWAEYERLTGDNRGGVWLNVAIDDQSPLRHVKRRLQRFQYRPNVRHPHWPRITGKLGNGYPLGFQHVSCSGQRRAHRALTGRGDARSRDPRVAGTFHAAQMMHPGSRSLSHDCCHSDDRPLIC